METSLLNSTLQSFCLDSKPSDFQDSSKCLGFFVNIASHASSVSKLKIQWPVYRTKNTFLAVQNLIKINNYKAAVRLTQTDSSSWFPCFVKGIFFLYFCVAPSPPTQAIAPQSNLIMLHSRTRRTSLLCSPSLGVQSPIHLGKQVLEKAWGCPPTAPSALKLLRAEDEELEEALQKICNFYHHFGDGDILHKERWQNQNQHETLQGSNKAISFNSPPEPICIPHQCLQQKQLTATRTPRAGW